MAEISFPQLTAERVFARILDAVRRPKIEIATIGDATPRSASQFRPTVFAAKAQGPIFQARRKSVPSDWRYSLDNIRRRQRLNESLLQTLAKLTKISQGVSDPLQKLDHPIDFPGGQATATQERIRHSVETGNQQQKFLTVLKERLRENQNEQLKQFATLEHKLQQRFLIYLPYVQNTGTRGGVLDLGCGRGEWMALLRDEGLRVQGVDINGALVARCLSRGLDVRQEDLLDYLRKQEDSSFAAITAFHVVEHLRFYQLVELLDQSLRVLVPGGIAIFETPNPGNTLASSNSFYVNPTDKKLLPPEVFKFLLKSRGFASCEILTLHPMPDSAHVKSKQTPRPARAVNEFSYCAHDYGVIARKNL
jgi:SAM-dependent methyltransferase